MKLLNLVVALQVLLSAGGAIANEVDGSKEGIEKVCKNGIGVDRFDGSIKSEAKTAAAKNEAIK